MLAGVRVRLGAVWARRDRRRSGAVGINRWTFAVQGGRQPARGSGMRWFLSPRPRPTPPLLSTGGRLTHRTYHSTMPLIQWRVMVSTTFLLFLLTG